LTRGSADERRTRWLEREVWGRHLSRRLVILTALLLTMAHIGNIGLVLHFYTFNADREREGREATARLLAEHASRAIAAIDLTLETLAETLISDQDLAPRRIQSLIESRIRRLPQARTLLVIGEDGRELFNSAVVPAHPFVLTDRPYFRALQEQPGLDTYITGRMAMRTTGLVSFIVARALRDGAGHFRGSVAAVADPGYFSSFYGTRDLGHDESAMLVRSDGAILAGTDVDSATMPIDATVETLGASRPGTVSTTRSVPSYGLQVVISGPSPWRSTAFLTFLIGDVAGMLALTGIALWLTGVLRGEAKAREKAETLLRDAFESAPAGFALFDADDRLVMCNGVYRAFYPAATRELLVPGASFETLARAAAKVSAPPDMTDPAALKHYVDVRLAAHRTRSGDLVRQRNKDTWVLIRECATDDGGTVVFETDISAMKQQEEALRRSERAERTAREQAERANRSKTSFLATMSHELRTPLNAIIGFSEIIECQLFGADHDRYRDYGGLIHRSGQHLLAIINDILDIAKLQSGKTELHTEPTAIGTMAAETLRLVSNQAEAAHLMLSHEIAPDLPAVRADTIRLRQVLINLLSNAIKFTPGGGRVLISARHRDGGVQIDVSDTGIGIAADDIPRALEPFGQVSNTLTRSHEGTGLGLPLSKNLIELHGARFEITSTVGLGTTVSIVFPAELAVTPETTTVDMIRSERRRATG
jgi:signal transduction histidine kinase